MKIDKKNKKGFSIGEVILSIFILSVGLVGTFKLYSDSVKIFADERDAVIASMLAQEGVELIRNVRDNNWADRDRPLQSGTGSSWEETFNNFPYASDEDDCRRGYLGSGPIICNESNFSLYINSDSFYGHDSVGATATKFKRRITLDYNDNTTPTQVTVTSLVNWSTSSQPPVSKDNCTLENNCIFSQATLQDWGTGS